jgi:hypothetical protein
MASRIPKNSLLSLFIIIPILLLSFLGACSKSKNTGVEASAAAPIRSGSDATADTDADSDEASTALEDCKKNDDDADEEEEAEDDESDAGLKGKGKENKGNKVRKDCPVPATGTGSPAPATGSASLAEGQKIYAANCQGCHGALPGEEQGASAQSILAAASIGPHKGIAPWPAAQASTLTAADAAASLAEAMK